MILLPQWRCIRLYILSVYTIGVYSLTWQLLPGTWDCGQLQIQLNDGIFANGRVPLRNKNFPLNYSSSIWNHAVTWGSGWSSPVSRGTSEMSRFSMFRRTSSFVSIRQILPCNYFIAPWEYLKNSHFMDSAFLWNDLILMVACNGYLRWLHFSPMTSVLRFHK